MKKTALKDKIASDTEEVNKILEVVRKGKLIEANSY